MTRHGIGFHSGSYSESSTALITEAEDLLYISYAEILFFRYDPKDGQHLSFTSDPEAPFKVFLNDRLISLVIYDDPIIWEWLEECEVSCLQQPRSLSTRCRKNIGAAHFCDRLQELGWSVDLVESMTYYHT
jgi:hypothetical protein